MHMLQPLHMAKRRRLVLPRACYEFRTPLVWSLCQSMQVDALMVQVEDPDVMKMDGVYCTEMAPRVFFKAAMNDTMPEILERVREASDWRQVVALLKVRASL
jgi:hypothetical protein